MPLNHPPSNIIYNLLDEEFILKFFNKRILPKYPDFTKIKKITIKPVKKHIWQTTYHVVIHYEVTFLDKNKKKYRLPIYTSAHSHEPRKIIHNVLVYLRDHDFSRGFLTIPNPLFYSNFYRAVFYRGVNGHNLLYYIKNKDVETSKRIVDKTAAWLAKLHALPAKHMPNFNESINRINTAIPGKKLVLEQVGERFPDHLNAVKKIYEVLSERERKFLSSTSKRWLIHGDAHPENVIKMGRQKIAVIDYTDFCLADFARDLGSFLQQLEYMCFRKTDDRQFTDELKTLFLDKYLKYAKLKLSDGLVDRIKTYYNWTAFRTSLFFLLKHESDVQRTNELHAEIFQSLKIS
jgi:thiamine kinase-like enzyme